MSLNNATRFAESVDVIKPLVYRFVWPNGKEELLTGTQMLEKGVPYLNDDCEIFEYEHVDQYDRDVQMALVNICNAAYTLTMNSSQSDENPHLGLLKTALNGYIEANLRKSQNGK